MGRLHDRGAGSTVVVLVPVLARPHRVAPVLESVESATESARVLFIASPGDEAELAALKLAEADWLEVEGNYAGKINAGVRATDEPFLFTGADDLAFHPGWFEAAVRTGAGVVGTQDLCNPAVIAGRHATHFLVARWYAELGTIDEPDKILHEGYQHEWVDNEFKETAEARGAYAFANDSVVEHLHPMVGKAETDSLYDAMPERMRTGRRVYLERRRLWQ